MSPGEELELTRQAAAGDKEASRRLVAAHQAAVYRYALALVRHRQDAEDVLQEVFLSFLKHAHGFRGDSSLRTWLLTITRHTAFRLRKTTARRQEEHVDLEQLGLAAGWGSANPERAAMSAEDHNRLKRALGAIGADDREILILCDLEEIPVREAAEAVGVTLAAAKSRLHRARLRLAASLRQGAPS